MAQRLWLPLLMTSLLLTAPALARAQAAFEMVIVNVVTEEKADGLDLAVYFWIRDGQGQTVTREAIRVPDKGGQVVLLGAGSTPASPSPVLVGEPQTPIRIVLLLDASGSMVPAMAGVKEAAKKAIDVAPAQAEMAVFKFTRVALDSPFTPVQDFTRDRELVKQSIDAVQADPSGVTCLYNAAYRAVEYLAARAPNPQDRRAVILFTDGKDEGDAGRPCSERPRESVIGIARDRVTTPIHTIGLCTQANCANVDRAVLEEIAGKTAAVAAFNDRSRIEESFQQIMANVRSQWVARSRLLARSGPNAATMFVPLGEGRGALSSQAFEFVSPRDFNAPPTVQLAPPSYDEVTDSYRLELELTNRAAVRRIGVDIVQLANQGGEGLVRPEQIVELSASQPTNGRDSLTIPARGASAGESLVAGASYCFRVRAWDARGQPIQRTESRDGDPRILARGCPGPYQPRGDGRITLATPRYDETNDTYLLDLRLTNPALVGTIQAEVLEGTETNRLLVRSERELRLTEPRETVSYSVPAEVERATASLTAGKVYCFALKARDKQGQPLRLPEGSRIGGDPEVLDLKCAAPYQPQPQYSIRSVQYQRGLNRLLVTLDLKRIGRRQMAVEGQVVAGERVLSPLQLSAAEIKDLRELTFELPTALPLTLTDQSYRLVLKLRDGNEVFPAVERSFTTEASFSPWLALATLGLAVAVIGVSLGLYRRSRRQSAAIPGPLPIYSAVATPPAPPARPAPSQEQPPARPAAGSPPAATALPPLTGETTLINDEADASPALGWRVVVVSGDAPAQFALQPGQHRFTIGRLTDSNRPDIGLTNPKVSRQHARLEVAANQLHLIAGDSANATYVGPEQRRLDPGETIPLHAGAIVWLSRAVQLRIEREG